MAEFFTVITDAGRELVARATQAGKKVNITDFAAGDGGGVPVMPQESQTQLVNECWRGLVATYSQQGDSLIIDTYIPVDEESFTIREMGVFTADGVLFAVCNTPEMRKVLPSEGAVGSFTLGMKLDVTNIDMSYIEIHTNPELDFIKTSEKGQPNGVPILDEHGKIPADNMPANTPTLGEDGKIPQEQLPDLNFDTAGSAAAVQNNLNAHINNKQNPHGVTAAQIGAISLNDKATLQEVQAGLIDNKWVTPYTLENSISLRSPRLTLLNTGSITTNPYPNPETQILTVFDYNLFKKYKKILFKIRFTPIFLTSGNRLSLRNSSGSNNNGILLTEENVHIGTFTDYEFDLYLMNSNNMAVLSYGIDMLNGFKLNILNQTSNQGLGYLRFTQNYQNDQYKMEWKIYGYETNY